MGLDAGFILKSRSNPDFNIEFAYFRNYFEFDDWMFRNVECKDEDLGYFTADVDLTTVKKLYDLIKPIYNVAMRYDANDLDYYEDNGEYPKEIIRKLCNTGEFNPTKSKSFASWNKLKNLYVSLEKMLDIFEYDKPGDLYFEYYRSF